MSEDILAIYDKIAPEMSQVYAQQTHIRGIREFVKLLPRKAKVLDLGCGSGKDVSLFRELGFESIGIDGSKGMIREGKKRFPEATLRVMDIRSIEFPDESFDAVWSWSVLTHLNRDDKALAMREVNRVLKKNGLFTQMIWRGRGEFTNQHVYPRPHFLLSISSWKKLYEESGFSDPLIKSVKGQARDFIRLTAVKVVRSRAA